MSLRGNTCLGCNDRHMHPTAGYVGGPVMRAARVRQRRGLWLVLTATTRGCHGLPFSASSEPVGSVAPLATHGTASAAPDSERTGSMCDVRLRTPVAPSRAKRSHFYLPASPTRTRGRTALTCANFSFPTGLEANSVRY